MRIDAIKIGNSPPDDVNGIIEVPIGGEPIKYESWTKLPELWLLIASYTPRCAIQAITVSCRTRFRMTGIRSMSW